jgi:hypothetical protein
MKVECVSRSADALPAEMIRPDWGLAADSQFPLVVGKQYVVYGITLALGHLWYYLCDEGYTYYPVWKPSPLFRVVDPRLPRCWQIGFHSPPRGRKAILIIAFQAWVDDPLFYDRLTDGEEEAVRVFSRYKRLMDAESECT